MKEFVESQFEVIWVYEFQTKANSYEDICWASVWSYLSFRVSTKTSFLWRHLLSLGLKLCKFKNFKKNRALMKALVLCQFEVLYVYEFETKANSYEDICWASVRSYIILWVSNKIEFWWTHLLSLSLKSCMFMSFKQKRIRIKTFVESQFEIMSVYEFQTKANYYEDNCWASVWFYVSLWVSKKMELLWRYFLSLSWRLCKFMSFKQKVILMKTFVECQFQVM